MPAASAGPGDLDATEAVAAIRGPPTTPRDRSLPENRILDAART
jgi:hypothetical protein